MAQGEFIYQLALRGIEALPDLGSMTPWELLCAAAGHLSFALSAASYMTTSLVRLRVLSVVAVSLGIFFNATLPAGPLWISVFWLSLFLLANMYRLLTGHFEDRRTHLSAPDAQLVGKVLPSIHPKDWASLKELATVSVYRNREIIPLGDVCWVVHGSVRNAATGFESRCWGASEFLGAKEPGEGSTKAVLVAREEGTSVLRVPVDALLKLAGSNLRLHKAVLDGLLRASLRVEATPSDLSGQHVASETGSQPEMVDNLKASMA